MAGKNIEIFFLLTTYPKKIIKMLTGTNILSFFEMIFSFPQFFPMYFYRKIIRHSMKRTFGIAYDISVKNKYYSMKNHTVKCMILLIGICMLHDPCIMSKTVTIETLLKEQTTREQISEYPSPSYVCKQFSSYDRARKKPGEKSWFSNWDRSMFIRTEFNQGRKEYVMMDTEGPGAIVRFWMTFGGDDFGKGTLRIYFDNDTIPAIQGNAWDILGKGKLVGRPLSASVSDSTDYEMRGYDLYLPLPYSRHCKITYQSDYIKDFGAKTGGEAVYYNINYRTYEPGTKVRTFSTDQLKEFSSLIQITQNKLSEKNVSMPVASLAKNLKGTILPGKSICVDIHKNSSAILKLSFKIEAGKIEQALRSTVLRISFDSITTVNCPMGDFFGTGYKIIESNTWYTKIDKDSTLSCYWVMPFRKNCSVSVENRGDQAIVIKTGEITTAPYKWTNNTMYFGSSWKQFSYLRTGEMKDNEGGGGPFDINFVDIDGKGVYVGDEITLFNTVYAWWGEGDEKVYIDNEPFPSHIGTGSEDYYGYAWCRPEKFTNHPFIAQPDGSGNFNPGYTNNLRFRSLDAIAFSKHLKFDMEMWHWTKSIIHYAPITFWYISPKDAATCPVSDLKGLSVPVALTREDIIPPVIAGNKIEGEDMKLENMTEGYFRYSNSTERGWSNNMQFVWGNVKPSGKLTMSFISDSALTADAVITFSKGLEYGDFKVSINGQDPEIVSARENLFKTEKKIIKKVELHKGYNYLNIEFMGSADNKTNRVGIDCIEFY